jgi:glycosyltransferase involved in cell wall biosynthesis
MDEQMHIPNLTVVIPTFNRLDMLKKILDSIPLYINVIISDNGSSVPYEFMSKYPTFTFYKTNTLLEALENWNNCISLVNTEWFIIPSDDDLYYEESFKIIGHHIKASQNSDLLVFGHKIIDENDEVISTWIPDEARHLKPPFAFSKVKYGVNARFPSIVFKKAIVVANGCFDTSFKITAGDSKLIQQCVLNGAISFIPEVIAAYRVWPNNSTSLTISTQKWLKEIDRWQDEILPIASKKFKEKGEKLNLRNIKDQVYATNFIVGIGIKNKNGGVGSALNFFLQNRFPLHANFKTQLTILKTILFG